MKDAELRKMILSRASEIECTEGVSAINIRRLAAETNIAVGTVYNYFESKQEVLLTLTEEYWRDTLAAMHENITAERFSAQLEQIIVFLRSKMNDCAEILMKNLHADADEGRLRMVSMQRILRQALIDRMDQDDAIQKNIWSDSFTEETFADFVLSNILFLLQKQDQEAGTFLEIVSRILYSNDHPN